MTLDPSSELVSFQQFIAGQLRAGINVSPEEALDLWRLQHPGPSAAMEDIAAVAHALSDMAAGDDGTPLDVFDREFRERHGLPRRG